MPPAPRPDVTQVEKGSVKEGSEILITGVSGRFPKSPNVKKFKENLYGMVDMLSETTELWDIKHSEVPPRMGLISDLDKFDAQFFAVHYKQAECIDPMVRKLLELACEAIVDAGMNPRNVRGTKTGVFMGGSIAENEKEMFYSPKKVNGYGLTGTSKTMYANRVSYWLDINGPSYMVDGNDCSGALVLEHAYRAIRDGHCDAAIIGCTNLSLFPHISLHTSRLGFLTKSGTTRSFDEDADGYARSDSVVVLYLQKAEAAKRAYCEVVHAKTIFTELIDEKEKFRYPCGEQMRKFLQDFYHEVRVKPEKVSYVEACGLGIKEFDKQELEQLAKVFCPENRKDPIMIGSVKSNMGNSETASGLCALVKALLSYHTGVIPPNLHLKKLRNDIIPVRDGRFKFVTEPIDFDRGYIAINSFAINGMNGHVLLQNFNSKKDPEPPSSCELAELVCVSGRVEDSIEQTFLDLESKPLDKYQVALVRSAHQITLPGFLQRGYNILTTEEDATVSLAKALDYYGGEKRPVWFVYSGMGSQWTTMGVQLMKLPVFAKAVYKCHKALEPYGVDLIRIITEKDETIFDNILNSFLGIAAIQIGLTDVLKEIGIQFDNLIGHSVGELGCAYADGCLTAEEMILSACCRGLVSVETPLIHGSMAAIGLGYNVIKSFLPPDIEAACRNGPDSCTISGPAESVKNFVAQLTTRGIFAKEVATSNIAYHSRYIAPAGDNLRKYLLDVIKNPKLRSERWFSTSVPQSKWNEPEAKYCSADYLNNNLLNPVLFEETSQLIPRNAITIEVAPHGLLQAILKRSLGPNCIHIPLTRRGHKDNTVYLLEAVGKMYMAGLHPNVQNLYPPMKFPVPTETSLISHTLRWEHSESWDYKKYVPIPTTFTGVRNVVLTTKDNSYDFMTGYVIKGVNYLAPAAQLVLVWETLGMTIGTPYKKLSVEFRDVHFDADVPIGEDIVEIEVMLQKASGVFEIVHAGAAISTGQILVKKFNQVYDEDTKPALDGFCTEDVYRMFAQRGFNYSGKFRSIRRVDSEFKWAEIYWKNNFVTLIDGVMQLAVLKNHGTSKPKFIQRMNIDLKECKLLESDNDAILNAVHYPENKLCRCQGLEIADLRTVEHPKSKIDFNMVQQYEFVPFENKNLVSENEVLTINIQTVVNRQEGDLQVVEISNVTNSNESYESRIHSIMNSLPLKAVIPRVIMISEDINNELSHHLSTAKLVIISELSNKEKVQKMLLNIISDNTFILSTEQNTDAKVYMEEFQIISSIATPKGQYVLLKKDIIRRIDHVMNIPKILDAAWIQSYTDFLKQNQNVLLVTPVENLDMLDHIENLHDTKNYKQVQFLIILDSKAPKFHLALPFYENQVKKGLTYNFYKDGEWGNYCFSIKEIKPTVVEYPKLSIATPGDINSLVWLQSYQPKKTKSNSVLVEVHYARISYSDLMKAQHRSLPGDTDSIKMFGISFAGVTENGKRVMGIVKNGAASSNVEADPNLLWPIPEHWTMEEAATVPQAYIEALYCLNVRANLKQGMKVLITSGAGALGQAAISICLVSGCEVFATVSDAKKKKLLLKLFPKLKESNICNTREVNAVDVVLTCTNGRGCDIVINTIQGSERHVIIKSAGPSSKFVDICLEDMKENDYFGMDFLWKEKAYFSAIFSNIFDSMEVKMLQESIFKGVRDGWIHPISHTTFEAQEAQKAFKLISSRRNHGAVLLRLRSSPSDKPCVNALSTWRCYEGVYIVIFGKNNLGVEVADTLINLGARKLVINTQNPETKFLMQKIKLWKTKDVKVTVSSKDLWDEISCTNFLKLASKNDIIKGIFVVKTPEKFEEASVKDFADCKLVGYLDIISRNKLKNLEKFVVVTPTSIITEGRLLDVASKLICEQRSKDGLHSLALEYLVNYSQNISEDGILETEYMSSVLQEVVNIFPILLSDRSKSIVRVVSTTQSISGSKLSDIITSVGLNIDDKENQQLKLREMGVNLTTAKSLSLSLNQKFGVYIAARKLLTMTLGELKELKVSNEERPSVEGLSMFFSQYDNDELQASEPIVWLPTLVSIGYETVNQYRGDDYLIVIPGMDGHRQHLLRLCQRLRLRALFYQHSTNCRSSTLQELAEELTKIITNRIGIGQKFYILGYSFGTLVALEMAKLLEHNGLRGKVFCLDGSHIATRIILESQLNSKSENDLQTEYLLHMCSLIVQGVTNDGLKEKLDSTQDWEIKLQHCIKFLRTKTSTTVEYMRTVMETGWIRITQTKTYRPQNMKLNSKIVLLRAKTSLNLPTYYGLQEVSSMPITVYELKASHATASYDLTISNIVNSELDDDIQYKFQQANLCVKNKEIF